MDANASASLDATVGIHPRQSQTFLVSLLGLAAITLVCGTILIAIGNNFGVWLVGLTFVLVVMASIGWLRSQSDTDLHHSHPAQITLSDGVSISADTRLLLKTDGINSLVRLCGELLARRPLPEPTGLVDAACQALPNSKDEAIAITNQINSSIQASTNSLIEALQIADDSTSATQPYMNLPEDIIIKGGGNQKLNIIAND